MFMRQDRLFLTLMIQLILSVVWMNLFFDQWILSRKVDNMLTELYSLKEWFILKENGICIMDVPIQRLVLLFTTLRILLYLTHCHKRYYFC